MKLEDKIMEGWQREILILEKQAKCRHEGIIWGADGKTGICVMCGRTIKREGEKHDNGC